YQARDAVLMLASLHNAKVLLGSATPSLESFYHARQGRYGWVTLNQRFGDAQLPQIELANLGREKKQKTAKGEFSSHLLDAIHEALGRNEQVIIFQNRRGHSPFLQCNDCGWLAKCRHCAVSLTYHQYRHALVCHYCGYHEPVPTQCPACSSKQLLTLGYGTEKLEEELRLQFPDVEIQRMDLDTTRSKHGYESILKSFESGKTQILVGTQMVTKGLDFDHVSLVGIFDADRMIHFPDFRSHERAFQLMTQVSGRAGRRDRPGKVVIQTNDPKHALFQWVERHD
ncbi:MAG: primosomal protein N', partial [Cyclobacteriaceae bacterium]